MAVLINIIMCKLHNKVNNIHSLPSGPCIHWGKGGGGGGGVAIAPVCTPLATGLSDMYMCTCICMCGHCLAANMMVGPCTGGYVGDLHIHVTTCIHVQYIGYKGCVG